MTETDNAEFIVVQRCATYGFWPLSPVQSDQFEINNPSDQSETSVSICTEHYGNLEDHRQPPKPIDTASRFAFGLSHPRGFRSGAEYYVDDKGLSISTERRFPFIGEVDVQFILKYASTDLPPDEIKNKFIDLMPALLLLMQITTQDVIVPSWRIQTISKSGGRSQQASPARIRMVRKDRELIGQEQISFAFKTFVSFLHPDSNKESALRLAVAARRIMNAFGEIDLIDRYCDLWEACEILCPKKHGKIDYRIAKRVADFTSFNQHRIKTKIISKLYRLRKDIVHSFVEDQEALSANLVMMFDISTLLYASYFGFSYSRKGALADTMQAKK